MPAVCVRWRAMRKSGSAVPYKIDLDRARLAVLAALAPVIKRSR